jgi:hypothetical protein
MKLPILSARARRLVEITAVVALCIAGIAVRLRMHADGTWAFAGSDSVGYAKLGHELAAHFRYALGPLPEPASWVRPPLYPIFLALVFPSGDVFHASWTALFATQIACDVGTGLLIFAISRKMAGPVAGVVGLALVEINPFTPLFSLAMLTETLATFLATATLAALVLGVDRPQARARRAWILAGALLAASTLLRPDGLLLVFGFLPAWYFTVAARREKFIRAALALAAFTVVFAPWPIRNVVQFRSPHPVGGRIDRFTRPVENYEGYWAWLRSWSRDYEGMTTPTTCFYDPTCNPQTLDDLRRRGAYVDIDDEARVRALIADRFRHGLTPENSRAFQTLADEHRRAHPLLVEAWFPLTRSWSMWVAPFEELLQGRPPWIWRDLKPHLHDISLVQALAWMIGGALLCLYRPTRRDGSILYATIVLRTLVLGYTFYSMPRYSIELMPTAYALIAGGLVVAARAAIQWPRQYRTRPTSA